MIRLGLRMLIGQTARWLGVVLGVLLCTFLITHMLSMFNGMMRRSYALVSDIPEARIWVMDPAVEYVDEPAGMPSTALTRVRGVSGVAWAVPLYTGSTRVRLPSGALKPILLIGVDDATLIGAPRDLVSGSLDALKGSDAVIIDLSSSAGLLRTVDAAPERHEGWNIPHLDAPTRPMRAGDEMLANDHRLVVVGVARLTPRFLSKPVVYTTYSRALFVTPRQRNLMSFVLAAPTDGQDAAAVARQIEARTGLRARTSAEFASDTYWYYVRTTGVVARIALMIGIAVIVGVSVSSLLLYLFTVDNARYYVTFKALGASTPMILRIVAAQALFSGLMGFGMGIGASSLLGTSVQAEAMPYALTPWTMLFAGVVVLMVCVISAVLSAMRVLKLDIATVFKG
ncbi:MAG: ABC transporter permease [Phycisphaerae bacterium]|nr:ABC transporter permease [Phycisphaerae bacterium]